MQGRAEGPTRPTESPGTGHQPTAASTTRDGTMSRIFRVFRGEPGHILGDIEYTVPLVEGMVVLDAILSIQTHIDTSLAVRWNCKAARCGSCSAEINGRPLLMCKARVDLLAPGPVTVHPMKTFPLVKDLVTDVSWNYDINTRITPFTAAESSDSPWRIAQRDTERLYEFRRCIECWLCQDVCHVLRSHALFDRYHGPRYFVRYAALEMHPRDDATRIEALQGEAGLAYCNVTKCCTEVCPEHIRIRENAIIPLKERVVDRHWDPLRPLGRLLRRLAPRHR
jgi:succinate dehydrogenase / fumarate reductase, iron-sulfur subunit